MTNPEERKNDEATFNSGFRNRLPHTSNAHISRLNGVIMQSTLIGALYGALFSIPTELLIRWRSPLYRAFGFRIRVFYHTICISSAAAFNAEKKVIAFENQIRREEEEKRRKLLELSVISGTYTPESEGFKSKK
ncbi:Rcf3 protein [Martiniozyma asiatica (nom. inval.)]|nr:Rcf3 protein [Martiniozyma asiatica]